MHTTLQEIGDEASSAFLFGGVLRDLMIYGASATPRDLDIVVSSVTKGMEKLFERTLKRRNRFGGYCLDSEGWLFDVWELSSTWAFRDGIVAAQGFEDLPRTTFLNIHAIVAELAPAAGKQRRIYSSGFFDAVASRTVDVNCEENPFPGLCVVRSFLAADKFGFGIAPRLAKYIAYHAAQCGIDELVDIQRKHYGRAYSGPDQLWEWIRTTESQLRTSSRTPVRLPRTGDKQLPLPFSSP